MSKHVGFIDKTGNVLPKLLKERAEESKGEIARNVAFEGAIAVADMVKTTLGPKGMDKILKHKSAYSSLNITNDGATILKWLDCDNPAAKILVDLSKIQDEQVGDGTTTVVVLAGELLREAEKLILVEEIHPQIVIQGYRMAVIKAKEVLRGLAQNNSQNPELFRRDLINIAQTTLSSKLVTQEKQHFAQMAVDAVLRLKGDNNLNYIKVIKKEGGQLRDSWLDEGFIIEKKVCYRHKKKIEKPKIAVANVPLDFDKLKTHGVRANVTSYETMAEIEECENEKIKTKIDQIIACKPDVIFNKGLIYFYPEELLTEAGITVVEHTDWDGIDRLSKVLDCDIIGSFADPNLIKFGTCELFEQFLIGDSEVIRLTGCPKAQASSIVIRGSSKHVVDEAGRSIHDAICVVNEAIQSKQTIWGGGYTELVMADSLDQLAKQTAGKKSIAIQSFARALRQLPKIIASNAGLDSIDLLTQLQAKLSQDPQFPYGLDIERGIVGNMQELGISECLKVKEHALLSAHEAAEQIIRVDGIIKCQPRPPPKMHPDM